MVASKKLEVEPFRGRLSSMIVHFDANDRPVCAVHFILNSDT